MSKGRWVIGQHAVEEAVKTHPGWVQELVFLEGRQREADQFSQQFSGRLPRIQFRGKKFLTDLGEGHQGLAARLSDRPRFADDKLPEKSLVVFLDGLTDPHNLGAVLRSAWLMGAQALFIPKNRAVDLTPVAARVASGAAEHVPVETCHFISQLEWFKKQGYWVYGLSEKADQSLPKVQFAERSVLVVGAEGSGVRSSTAPLCDVSLSIPQVCQGPSYNASVAFAICAYDRARQQRF